MNFKMERLSPMLSYAQQAEDVILRRAFLHTASGFYVDVGAASPVYNSVTKYFYLNGWSGINLEPNPEVFDALRADRPRDINLRLAVGPVAGRTDLLVYERSAGLSTTSQRTRRMHAQAGLTARKFEVPVEPLDNILEEYATGKRIDFMKVDVEGSEAEVIRSISLNRWKPRIIVIEATEPGCPKPCYEQWEQLILSEGYTMALFDGLNRWYAFEPELIEAISLPANTFDNYVPYKWWRLLSREARADQIDRFQLDGQFVTDID